MDERKARLRIRRAIDKSDGVYAIAAAIGVNHGHLYRWTHCKGELSRRVRIALRAELERRGQRISDAVWGIALCPKPGSEA